jgi:hypothetical protein
MEQPTPVQRTVHTFQRLQLIHNSPGLAWMHSDGESTPQFSNLKLFTDWPGKNEPKVPSEVSYSMASGTASDRVYRPWGSTIDPKSKVLRWTKLKLFQDYSPLAELETLEGLIKGLADIKSLYSESDETTDVPRHLSRTSKDIIEFYLSFIAEEWVAYVTNQAQFVLDEVPVDIVVTHPAMWPDHARGALVQAVSGAFNKIIIPTRQNIYVKSEPEACTLYVIQDVLRKNAGALRVVSLIPRFRNFESNLNRASALLYVMLVEVQ